MAVASVDRLKRTQEAKIGRDHHMPEGALEYELS
jgi:hypothetical protein